MVCDMYFPKMLLYLREKKKNPWSKSHLFLKVLLKILIHQFILAHLKAEQRIMRFLKKEKDADL